MVILVPDLGHGNCVCLFDKESDPLMIDCGTFNNDKKPNFVNLIFNRLKIQKNVDFAITHFHGDHYNLVNMFQDKFFSTIYLPALPQTSNTANIMLEFMSIANVLKYSDYYLSTIVQNKSKRIYPLIKGNYFLSNNQKWDVVWPDYNILDSTNRQIITSMRELLDDVIESLTEEKRSQFEDIYNNLSHNFSTNDICETEPNYYPHYESYNQEILHKMIPIEKKFKTLANRASLVFHNQDETYLFTGDVDQICLNNYLSFNKGEYFLVEASHHGGYYGSAFNNIKTRYLLLSRMNNYKVDERYYTDIDYELVMDTSRLKNIAIMQNKGFKWHVQ